MINFKDPKDQAPSAFAVLGIVLILGAVIVSLFFNRRVDAKSYAANSKRDLVSFKNRTEIAQANLADYEATIDKYRWEDKEDLVTPAALTIISKRSAENQLKLVSFRPLKSYEGASMVQLPLQFTVDGSFASVAAMLEAFEKPESKLAVNQVQFASQEGETDKVSANITMVAYLGKPEPVKKKTTKSSITAAPATTTKSPTGVITH